MAPSCAGPALFSLRDPGESFLPAGPAVGSLELLPLLLLLLLAAQPGQTGLEQAWAVTSLPFLSVLRRAGGGRAGESLGG